MIGRLTLLREQFGSVTIPKAVAAELAQLKHPSASEAIQEALTHGWLTVEDVSSTLSSSLLASGLDLGEAEAIALAVERQSNVVLLDERRARTVAKAMALRFTGLLGVLLRARLRGRIESLRSENDRLRSDARFFVDRGIERQILSIAGESASDSS